MKSKFIKIFILAIALLLTAVMKPPKLFAGEALNKAIESILPDGWGIIETKENEIPWGHYLGQNYEGQRGTLLVLRGPANIQLNWQDREGNWKRIPLAKEVLEICIMHPGYHDSWKRFFFIHRPIPATKIYSGNLGVIFGHPTHRITSESKFKEILSQAKATGWPDSPHNEGKLSWSTWKSDLNMAIRNLEK
ncbi:MAG: hypothetical protein E4H46_01790 [Desulfobacterales bacterium]|nr:MAG: hypothetical protein E4H46_01790 [Desulfobacterales bacterium]